MAIPSTESKPVSQAMATAMATDIMAGMDMAESMVMVMGMATAMAMAKNRRNILQRMDKEGHGA